jgi:hypothetical protein
MFQVDVGFPFNLYSHGDIMATITKFEDLIAWQEARRLVKMLYKLTSDGSLSKDFGSHYEQAKKTKALIGGLRQSILKNPRRPSPRTS